MSFKTALLAASITLAFTPPLPAQDMDHGAMNHDAMGDQMGAPRGDQGPSSQAFAKANVKMHSGMDLTYTGKADVDFARGMIAHHQGAIDMARIELDHGRDPTLRALAEAVIKAQEAEIAEMKAWLAKNGG